MNCLDLSLPSPEENLACDEVLLDLCDEAGGPGLLRFWEPRTHFVVLGYANRAATEVNLAYCAENAIPVLRRCSGGGTVLQGPGCLNYSLLLPIHSGPELESIPGANAFVLERHRAALALALQAPVDRKGHTDLAVGGLKFCGNAQRRKKNFLLFHGCFLLRLDIDLVERTLPLPTYQPDYRLRRSHTDFLMNLGIPGETLKDTLRRAWSAIEPAEPPPSDEVRCLAEEKYGRDEWNLKF